MSPKSTRTAIMRVSRSYAALQRPSAHQHNRACSIVPESLASTTLAIICRPSHKRTKNGRLFSLFLLHCLLLSLRLPKSSFRSHLRPTDHPILSLKSSLDLPHEPRRTEQRKCATVCHKDCIGNLEEDFCISLKKCIRRARPCSRLSQNLLEPKQEPHDNHFQHPLYSYRTFKPIYYPSPPTYSPLSPSLPPQSPCLRFRLPRKVLLI